MPNFNATRGRWYFTKIVFASDALRGFAQWSAEKKGLGCRERSDCNFGYRALPCLNIQPGTYFNTACRFL